MSQCICMSIYLFKLILRALKRIYCLDFEVYIKRVMKSLEGFLSEK